jgi:hypothetical protein
MFFTLLLSTLSFACTQPTYQGKMHTEATAYGSGEKFSRSFSWTATYKLDTQASAKATTSEQTHCEYDDEYPTSCAQYCDTVITLVLGTVTATVHDLDHKGLDYTTTVPVTADGYKSEPKPAGGCANLDLSGLRVFSKETFVTFREPSGNSLELHLDPYDSDTRPGDHVVDTTLRALGNDAYGLNANQPTGSTRSWWAYNHLPTWGTSGDARMDAFSCQ